MGKLMCSNTDTMMGTIADFGGKAPNRVECPLCKRRMKPWLRDSHYNLHDREDSLCSISTPSDWQVHVPPHKPKHWWKKKWKKK